MAWHAEPKTALARMRLLWHDFIIHGIFNRGKQLCQDCGRTYQIWRADDAEWNQVMGGPWGILCFDCFQERRR